jgi:hypothetical protein
MKTVFPLICMFGFGWCLWGCSAYESYPSIPEIHFKKLVVADTVTKEMEVEKLAFLTFSFVDGDGDIGISPQDVDSISKIHYTWYQRLPDSTYKPYQFSGSVIMQTSNIPWKSVMDKTKAQNKVLKGTIRLQLFTPTTLPEGVDTMRVEYYIFDRAGNQSNVDFIPDFSMRNPPAELSP